MTDIYKSLVGIVEEAYVLTHKEELYFYARDPGLMPAHEPDYVVAPKTTEEVQEIVKLANKEKVPIVPMGAGISLAGLVIPLKGGIVIDMKRMRRILEVNEKARYAVVEGGILQGVLKAYLEKNHPNLEHSLPEAPPSVTIGANVAIHGQGHLSPQHGFNSDMVSGLEVVLPTGEISRIGSYSMTPYWFSKGPSLPDISGLFLGWLGTTGIITKVGLKLYPKKKIRDFEIFVTDRAELVPEIVFRLTHTGMTENLGCFHDREQFTDLHLVVIHFTGDTDEEIKFKRKMIWGSVREFIDSKDGGFMAIVQALKDIFLDMPMKDATKAADDKKGGGFEIAGPIALVEKYPVFVKKIDELADEYRISCSTGARILDQGRSMMHGMAFPFNRADPDEMDRARKVLHEANKFEFEQGAIPWKPTVEEQKRAIERMDPTTLKIMKMIKENLDPNGIMNPGNWEVS